MGTISSLLQGSDPTCYVYGLAAAVSALVIFSYVASYWRLRQWPGPPLAAWTQLWYFNIALTGEYNKRLSDVNTKYGPLARIGPNTLITCDEELYRKTNSPRSGYKRGDFYESFRFGAKINNVFSETDAERHSHLRKRVAPGYSGRENSHLEPDMDAVILSLVKSWKERYISDSTITKPMDLAQQVQYLALDIVSSLGNGEPYGFVTADSDLYEYISTLTNSFPIMLALSVVPAFSRLIRTPWVARFIAPSVKDSVGMGKMKAVSSDIISKRFEQAQEGKEEKDAKTDFTTSFIAHKLTPEELADGAILTLIAGSDTTGVVLRSGLNSILTQPRIIRKLQAEADEANIPKDEVISYERSLELPYLQACVKESLRCNPPASGAMPRIVPPQGDHFQGKFIPGGTEIGLCAWNIHRLNYDAYGPDAQMYRPERWIEAQEAAANGDSTRLDRMEKAHELIFGYGEFKCLGTKVAFIQLTKMMFELIRRYEYGFINGMKTIEQNENYGIFIHHGMMVRVEER